MLGTHGEGLAFRNNPFTLWYIGVILMRTMIVSGRILRYCIEAIGKGCLGHTTIRVQCSKGHTHRQIDTQQNSSIEDEQYKTLSSGVFFCYTITFFSRIFLITAHNRDDGVVTVGYNPPFP
jgi:hypothetical protein